MFLTLQLEHLENNMFDRLKDAYSGLAHVALDSKQLKTLLIKLTVVIILYLVLVISGGLIRFYGMLHNQIIIFMYILEFVAALSLLNSIFTLLMHYKALTPRDIDKSINRFSLCSNTLIVLCAISFIASIIYCISEGFHNDGLQFALYLLDKAAIILLTLYFKYITKDVYIEDDKKEEY